MKIIHLENWGQQIFSSAIESQNLQKDVGPNSLIAKVNKTSVPNFRGINMQLLYKEWLC